MSTVYLIYGASMACRRSPTLTAAGSAWDSLVRSSHAVSICFLFFPYLLGSGVVVIIVVVVVVMRRRSQVVHLEGTNRLGRLVHRLDGRSDNATVAPQQKSHLRECLLCHVTENLRARPQHLGVLTGKQLLVDDHLLSSTSAMCSWSVGKESPCWTYLTLQM